MLSEKISTNSQKIALTILKNKGVSTLRRISQCASCTNTFPQTSLSESCQLQHGGSLCWLCTCTSMFSCSENNLPEDFSLQDSFKMRHFCALSRVFSCFKQHFYRKIFLSWIQNPFQIQRFLHKQRYLQAVDSLFPPLLSQQWTIFSGFDTDT